MRNWSRVSRSGPPNCRSPRKPPRRQPCQERVSVQHEPRDPDTAQRRDRMGRLLLDTQLEQEQRLFATIMCSSGEALLEVINASSIFPGSSRKLSLETLDFDLRASWKRPPTDGREGHEKGLELVCEYCLERPACCARPWPPASDPSQPGGNAVKLPPRRGASRWNWLARTTPPRRSISRSRHGIGVRPDNTRHFSPFVQETGPPPEYGGTGLGLSISKHVACWAARSRGKPARKAPRSGSPRSSRAVRTKRRPAPPWTGRAGEGAGRRRHASSRRWPALLEACAASRGSFDLPPVDSAGAASRAAIHPGACWTRSFLAGGQPLEGWFARTPGARPRSCG